MDNSSSTSSSNRANDGSNQNEEDTSNRGLQDLKPYILNNKMNTGLWLSRGLTLIFCFLYIFPIFGSAHSSYHKALMSNAASCALRLNQRIPNFQFSREFLATLLTEDSAHYLFYSFIFLYSSPITMVLVPIFIFALLHFASYSLILLDVIGKKKPNALGSRFFISLVEFQQRNMLRGAAFVEIFLMPLTVVLLFMGRTYLLTPFIYYRFLTMRYCSRRNTYTRNMFYELRLSTESVIHRSFVPPFARNLALRAITFVSSLAPPQVPVSGAQ